MILPLLVIGGLALRIWGIKGDLPYTYYGDENYLIYHSLKFGAGDFNPHWFVWPTFYPYLLFFLFAGFYILGHMLNLFKNSYDFLYLYFKDPTVFFLIGRSVSAVLGAGSIVLTYFIAAKFYEKKTALLSAAFFAFLPLAVEYSHYAVVDTSLVFMMLLTFLYITKVFLGGRKIDYILSGFFLGLAIATKYPAVFLIAPLLLAHILNVKNNIAKIIFCPKIMLALFFTMAGFVLACPFSILDSRQFMSDMNLTAFAAKVGWFGWEKNNPYFYHLKNNLNGALGPALLIVSGIGIFYAIWRRKKTDLILFVFMIVYFLGIGWNVSAYGRFMLPLLPLFCVFGAKGFWEIEPFLFVKGKPGRIAEVVLALALLFYPLAQSIKIDLNFLLPDTRTLAKDWIEKNIPAHSAILANVAGPPLTQSPEKIRIDALAKPAEELKYSYHKKRDFFYQVQEDAAGGSINYEISYLHHPIAAFEGKPGYERLMAQTNAAIVDFNTRYDFVVISQALIDKLMQYPRGSIPARYQHLRDFYGNIFNNYIPVKVFEAEKNISKGHRIMVYKL